MTNTANNNRPTRAYGVVRCSTKMQADSRLGLEAQREAIRAYCEANGLELIDTYEDAAKSGGLPWAKRAGMVAALKAATRDGGVIVLGSVSRIGRNTADVLTYIEAALKGGAQVMALDSQLDYNTPAGLAMVSVMAAFAQLERSQVSARTKAANDVKRSRGERTAGPKSNIDPAARELMHRRRLEGATLRTIAAELNAAGYVTGSGKATWSHGNVACALQSYRVVEGAWVSGDPAPRRRGRRVAA